MKTKKWNEENIKKLTELYPDKRNEFIAKQLNISESSIINKARRLKLRKNPNYKKVAISKKNKKLGRDLTFKLLQEIALRYKTKGQFQKEDSSAYQVARRAGYLPEICKHMSVVNFSIPQLILRNILDSILNTKSVYNDRKTIKPYEIDIYYPTLNLAFEYQGKGWHKKRKTDFIKLELFKKNKINIIYIIENNRNYEDDIKLQLINQLPKVNEICNTSIKICDILNCVVENIYFKIYNKEELINIAKNYNLFKDFIKLEKSVYTKLWKMKLLDEATIHMKDRRKRHTELGVKQIVSKYTTLKELIKSDFGIYQHIKRNNLEHLICNLKDGRKH